MYRILLFLFVFLALTGTVAFPKATKRRVALRELVKHASEGDPKALYDLSRLHDTGYDSIPVDSARSAALCLKSAIAGYAPAQNYIGTRYFEGRGMAHDVDSALYWIEKAAGNGDARAANNLGYLAVQGRYVAKDYGQALKWFSLAADAGLPTGQSQLADMYRSGLGTLPDTLKAVRLYTQAIQSGLQDAEKKLLDMMGRKWETIPVDSMLSIGRYYYTHKAPVIGVTLFENAAAQGDADAFALLGDAYSRAKGVDYNHDRSISCFLRAALGGQPSAQFVIAELLDIFPDMLSRATEAAVIADFYKGREVPPDIASAQYWYEKASAGGVTDSRSATRLLYRQ